MAKLIKIFTVLAIFTIISNIQARNINYEFNIKQDSIQVTLTMQGDQSESSKFRIPTIFELDKLQKQKIKVYINNLKHKYTTHKNFILIKHQPLASIKISYELSISKTYDSNLYFDLTSEYFFLFGQYCLLTLQVNFKELNDISFKFYSQYAKNLKIFSNLNYRKNNLFSINSVDTQKLEDVFFIGGNIAKYQINDQNLSIFFSKNVMLNKTEVINYLSKIESIHNNFFQKSYKTSYYIFLSNLKNRNVVEGSQISNIQTISIGADTDIEFSSIKRTIAHENLHKWLNSKNFGEHQNNQGYNCWFIEGFTDYYTDYLGYKNNIISLNEYLSIYNKVLLDYYKSPLKLVTNSELGNNIYDHDIFQIAYLRGKIIAHELNYLISSNTDGKLDLDNYMKYLIQLSISNKIANFNLSVLKNTLFDFTGKDFSKFLNDNILKNKLNVKAKLILNNKAFLTSGKFKKIVYDFDFLESQLRWIVSGVNNNSEAFLSGLRNGQKILSIITTTTGLKFKINDKGIEKTIEVPRKYQEICIPQYVISY